MGRHPNGKAGILKKMRNLAALLALTGSVVALHAAKPQASNPLANLPLSFEANRGQTDPRVRFLVRQKGFNLFLTPRGSVMVLNQRGKSGPVAVRMNLVGANAAPRMEGLAPLEGRSNYFIGSDAGKWLTGVEHYGQVRYAQVYPGIDLIFHGSQTQAEFDFSVSPGSDPERIRLSFEGVERVSLDSNGDLVLRTPAGEMRHLKPRIYQETAGRQQLVDGRYVLKGNRQVGFKLGGYDSGRNLVIDPVLAFSTYVGGLDEDYGESLAIDSAGNTYITGVTSSSGFPTTAGAVQTGFGGGTCGDATQAVPCDDVFVTKLNAAGTAIVYSTFMGGNLHDGGRGIAVDAAGNAYVTGDAGSINFPTTGGAFQRAQGGTSGGGAGSFDAFVAKLNPAGNALLYSTLLGGFGDEVAYGIAIDGAGNAYVAGLTVSNNFPATATAFRRPTGTLSAASVSDGFVTKLNPNGTALVYSTVLVGSATADTTAYGIAVDSGGSVYVGGVTSATNFPATAGAFGRAIGGGTDGFVAKLTPEGSSLVYAALIGGNGDDAVYSMAVDSANNAYVTGLAGSSNFPVTPGAFQTTLNGSFDAFVSKISPTGATLIYSTLLGGSGSEQGNSVVVDAAGSAILTGSTDSSNFPKTPDALQPAFGGADLDAYVTRLNAAGTGLVYSSYLGGNGYEEGLDLAVDGAANVYVIGYTDSSNFPTTAGVLRGTPVNNFYDLFVTKINIPLAGAASALRLATPALSFAFQQGGTTPPAQTVAVASSDAPLNFTVVASGGAWLSVTPAAGATPGTLTVSVNPAGLAPGNYNGAITISSTAASNSPQAVTIALAVTAQAGGPTISSAGFVNAASFVAGPLSPGEIVTIFGAAMGPSDLTTARLDAAGLIDNSLAETRVLFDGVPAPIIYTRANQVSAVVPYGVSGKSSTEVQAEYRGVRSSPITLPVAPSATGVFAADSSGRGLGAIQNQDGSFNSSSNPAAAGSIIVLYATGEGQTDPAGVNGRRAIGTLPKPLLAVSVKIGGLDAEVLYAGAAPTFVAGLMQVNARIPAGTPASSSVPLLLTVGAATSQTGITVAVK